VAYLKCFDTFSDIKNNILSFSNFSSTDIFYITDKIVDLY